MKSKTEVVNEPKYSTSTASSRGRASSTTSSKVTASPHRRNQSTSPVRARNNSVGPARRAASDNTPPPVANTEVTGDNPAFAIANGFYLFVKYLIDNPHYLNMIFVTLCIAATYLFYKANNASYALASSGSAVVAILIQTFILLNSRKSKRQQLVYNLVQIIKQMIKKKSERNRLGYAVEDVLEDILDKIEDNTWDSNTIATVRELTIEKFNALWEDVKKGVTEERRILLQTGVEVDKKKCDFWKYKGVQDPIAPVFGFTKASYAGSK